MEDFAEVGWEWIEVNEVGVGNFMAALPAAVDGAVDGPPGRSPADHEEFCVVNITFHRYEGNVVGYSSNFVGPKVEAAQAPGSRSGRRC